ncbi:hypothetical protein ACFVT5_40985 [Streptomyces sp. NPDC058001]|uniref:hypothetical protein n=1 Tax=Streptomyces sp. NPDC058001 TaxID=3346300 RepID=UPI0036EDE1E6
MPSTPSPLTEQQLDETVTVNYADVELDNGENLRDLGVGDYLELSETVAGMTPGTWQVVAWRGEFQDKAVMRLASTTDTA